MPSCCVCNISRTTLTKLQNINLHRTSCMEMADELNGAGMSIKNDSKADRLLRQDNVLIELDEFKRNYESVFSWDIKEQTGGLQILLSYLREQYSIEITSNDTNFNAKRFYLSLTICHELYINGEHEESLKEIKDIIEYMDSCTFNDTYQPYSTVYHHIAHSTFAYMALAMNNYSDKIIGNIKPAIVFNQEEKSAVCAIKSCMFMMYAPKGNFIGLKFANEARELNPTEPEWICIWLLVKGRVRRYNFTKTSKPPETCEIDAVEQLLCIENPKPSYLLQVSVVYSEAAIYFRYNSNQNKSNEYYELSIKILKKAITLFDENNEIKLCNYALKYIYFPEELHSKSLTNHLVEKLKKLNNQEADFALGLYYLKIEKEYETAKRYLTHAMVAGGTFKCAMKLFEVECLLQPTEKLPIVQMLNQIYDTFISPNRRLIVLVNILIYYHSCECNEQELMHYLKLYMDQDIDNGKKITQLYEAWSIFKNPKFKRGQFLAELTSYIHNITNNYEWKEKEKEIVNDTYYRFNEMLKANNKVSLVHDNKNHFRNICYRDSDQKDKQLQNNRVKESSWRTKQDRSMKNENTYSSEVNNQEKNESCKSSNRRNNLQSSNEDKNLSWRNYKGDKNEFQKTKTNYSPAGCSRLDEHNKGDGYWTESSTYSKNSVFGTRRNSKPKSMFPPKS